MVRTWKALGYLCALAILASCSRDVGNDATVRIDLPTVTQSKVYATVNATNAAGGGDGPAWDDILNPTSLGQINCYGVFVGGPGLDKNVCGRTDTGEVKFSFGPSRFFIPAGGQIELPVPSGPDREIILVGVQAQNGSCRGIDPNSSDEPDFQNMSYPHILARQRVDLQPGDQTVTLSRNLNPSDIFNDCDFIDDHGSGGDNRFDPDFGSGTENKVVTTGGTIVDNGTGQFCASGECGAYGRVEDVVGGGNSYTVTMAGGSEIGFSVGDRVIAIVSEAFSSANGPDSYCGGGPGEAFVGAFSGHTIQGITGTNLALEGSSRMFEQIAAQPDRTTRLGNSTSGDFCYVQLVKMVELNSLDLYSQLQPPNFDRAGDDGGGVLALKIKDELKFNSGGSISASGAGFEGGAVASDGFGHGGSTAGRAGAGTEGGGGGGHMGPHAFAGHSGGDGGENPGSAGGSVNSRHEEPKPIFGGGGGGAVGATGSAGGGMIFLEAKIVDVTSATAYVKADGSAGGAGGGASGGSGGGAGGFVQFAAEDLLSSGGTLEISVEGGSGGNGGASNGSSGGGGSAGAFLAAGCPHVLEGLIYNAFGGPPGTPGGAGFSGNFGEDGFQAHQLFRDTSNCAAGLVATGPREVEFGNHAHPATFTHMIEIRNVGGSTANNISGTISGTSGVQFTNGNTYPGLNGTCGSDLPRGQTCTMEIELSTQGGGATDLSGYLDLDYDDTANGKVALYGSVDLEFTEDLAEVDPALDVVNAGSLQVGQTSAPILVTISNNGFSAATGLAAFIGGEFAFVGGTFPGTGGTCSGVLGAGASCNMTIEFTPGGPGPRHARLDYSYDDGTGNFEYEGVNIEGHATSPPPPPEPTGFVVTTQSQTTIDISWGDGGGSTAGFIVNFQVGASPPADCDTGSPVDVGAATSHTLTGLTANTSYGIRVCSRNSANDKSIGQTVIHTTDP